MCERLSTYIDPLGENEKDFHFLHLKSIGDLPSNFPFKAQQFSLFLACNATEMPVDVVSALATTLRRAGMVGVCCWGPGCERVHDIFDEVGVMEEIQNGTESTVESVIVTTWHPKESLVEALGFFAFGFTPAAKYVATCRSFLVVVVDHVKWSREIRTLLLDLDGFNQKWSMERA